MTTTTKRTGARAAGAAGDTKAQAADAERAAVELELHAAAAATESAQAAELALRERAAEISDRERLAALDALAADVTAASDPAEALAAIDQIRTGVAALVRVLSDRDRRVAETVRKLQELGVTQTSWRAGRADAGEIPGWRAGEQGGYALFIPGRVHAVRSLQPGHLIDGAVGLALHDVNVRAAAASITLNPPRDFLQDHEAWLAQRW